MALILRRGDMTNFKCLEEEGEMIIDGLFRRNGIKIPLPLFILAWFISPIFIIWLVFVAFFDILEYLSSLK